MITHFPLSLWTEKQKLAGLGKTQAAGNHVFHSAYPGSVARMGYTASSFARFINSQDHSKSTHRETIAPLGIEKQPHPG